ncbi:hypothetical protein, partial [Eggerthella sinensis]|uniref:hypothetical protein n=1 Tax=Eggerthella sinensis TaxID=242230 RepID=UPI00266C6B48
MKNNPRLDCRHTGSLPYRAPQATVPQEVAPRTAAAPRATARCRRTRMTVKDYIDTNDFTKEELLDMIELARS